MGMFDSGPLLLGKTGVAKLIIADKSFFVGLRQIWDVRSSQSKSLEAMIWSLWVLSSRLMPKKGVQTLKVFPNLLLLLLANQFYRCRWFKHANTILNEAKIEEAPLHLDHSRTVVTTVAIYMYHSTILKEKAFDRSLNRFKLSSKKCKHVLIKFQTKFDTHFHKIVGPEIYLQCSALLVCPFPCYLPPSRF